MIYGRLVHNNILAIDMNSFYFNSFNKVLAANFPNLSDAKGLAPGINFLSRQTESSDLVFTILAPKLFNFSLKP